ncbi:pyridoxal phosphate-dependent aminotransferase [Microbacterium sp. BWT-B31]|uniref:pyridoxal phosphate-dependent aminotransferase n=1 Tax=Microbacterium sp. BWT-B31 TaxID=3232072 RepID=UPI0035281555
MPEIAAHIVATPGSGIRHIYEIALQRPGTIMLAVGEPSAQVAQPVRDAAAAAWRAGRTRYTANAGISGLREAIAATLARQNGLQVGTERIWVTAGATQALHQAMALVLAPGDEVLVPDPGYTTFTMNAHMLSARPVPYALTPERGFQPDLDALERLVTPRTRAIIVNSPSNPLGSTFSRATLQAIVDLAVARDLWVISDEVYERFTWGEPHVSLATLSGGDERVLSVFSVSKTYAMTGARVGWLVTPPGFEAVMPAVQEAAISCVNAPAQEAAVAALTGSQEPVEIAARAYRENLAAACRVLDERGIGYLEPTGAFYLWIDVSHATDGDVAAWAERFLIERGVAVAPGSAFGASGEGWIRVCVASDLADLEEGLRRLPAPR